MIEGFVIVSAFIGKRQPIYEKHLSICVEQHISRSDIPRFLVLFLEFIAAKQDLVEQIPKL